MRLFAQIKTLREEIARHKSSWEELQNQSTATKPFPACSEYDDDLELSMAYFPREVDDLKSLATEIRHRIAQSEPALYYSESDIRLFLAGLASSRLHLLQGISGTGKTSLPQRFFEVIGGDKAAVTIEVQAGWRDQDDLFGYYNAFEKRFVESEFSKALYRALLPANEDRPMVIILDEMNLSHPEQYFGTMLSILEKQNKDEMSIALLSSAVEGLPEKLVNGRLPIPENVWFVGTANHDETTVAFADKTYDRSHVQELPVKHVEFSPDPKRGEVDPISFSELKIHFERAKGKHKKELSSVLALLDGPLRDAFSQVGVGWGSRLERQLNQFVPVVISSGGTATEALDHVVATRLIRKVVDRFDIRVEDLELLLLSVQSGWELDGLDPVVTVGKLKNSIDRLRK